MLALVLPLALATLPHRAQAQASTGQVYRWTDKTGTVNYGKSAPANAQNVTVVNAIAPSTVQPSAPPGTGKPMEIAPGMMPAPGSRPGDPAKGGAPGIPLPPGYMPPVALVPMPPDPSTLPANQTRFAWPQATQPSKPRLISLPAPSDVPVTR